MNRIEKCFDELRRKNEKALITFVTAGDPDLETTEKLVYKMFDSGADIIELGVPFSDPIAEGVTIQRASLRSLNGGTNLTKIFETVKRIREKTDKPLILMMYINTIYVYGTERFFAQCREYGIDGVIVPDLPFEERDEVIGEAEKNGILQINLVAPTSHDRIREIASASRGFLYCVSSTGVTGTRSSFTTDFEEFFGTIKKYVRCPYAVGFGISNPEQAKKMAGYCSGVIVGSAIVRIVAENGRESVDKVGEFVSSLKKAI
ncbi:MAG: tryptophan synthase subunit alpha [Oscillospiraceae bacterium]|nr:tryptophan synthase subunit alpha [Oscillospiraceae bacterium]